MIFDLPLTLIDLTRLAVLLATSFADWTKCRLATGLLVLEEATLQELHSADVCLATIVAAESTYTGGKKNTLSIYLQHTFYFELVYWANTSFYVTTERNTTLRNKNTRIVMKKLMKSEI